MKSAPLLLVGPGGPASVTTYLARAARELGRTPRLLDTNGAYPRHGNVQRLYQRAWRARPFHLEAFSASVREAARALRPRVCVAVGNAPLTRQTLEALSALGVRVGNFSTDDPWNGRNWSRWRIPTLPAYAAVFTPRRDNLAQLEGLGCSHVEWLPFAYDPLEHRPAREGELGEPVNRADVVFIGGADEERVPFMRGLVASGLCLRLYGGYWDRYRDLRPYHGGNLSLPGMRQALAHAKVSVCLVRRANRDQHVMRTYEEPAMGSCMLLEDTGEHRALFSAPVAADAFFRTPEELRARARAYCDDASARRALAVYENAAIVEQPNRYRDRLARMLAVLEGDA